MKAAAGLIDRAPWNYTAEELAAEAPDVRARFSIRVDMWNARFAVGFVSFVATAEDEAELVRMFESTGYARKGDRC